MIFMQSPNFMGLNLGSNFLGSKFLGAQISWGPKKVRGPNEIGDHFSYSRIEGWEVTSQVYLWLKYLTSFCFRNILNILVDTLRIPLPPPFFLTQGPNTCLHFTQALVPSCSSSSFEAPFLQTAFIICFVF